MEKQDENKHFKHRQHVGLWTLGLLMIFYSGD